MNNSPTIITAREGLCFRNDGKYDFAMQHRSIPIGLHELQNFVTVAPIGLIKLANESWRLSMGVALQNTRNLFVGPQGGWRGLNVPERIAIYPLSLYQETPDDEPVLAYTEESPRLFQGDEYPLFDENGEVTEAYKSLKTVLMKQVRSDKQIARIAEIMESHGCLKSIEALKDTDAPQSYNVAPRRLHSLSGDALSEMHKIGGIALAYAMYYSTANSKKLMQLARQQQADVPPEPNQNQEDWFGSAEEAVFNFDI